MGYLVGWHFQRFELTIFIILGTAACLLFLIGPGWPLCKTNEPKWLDQEKLGEYVKKAGVKVRKD